MKKLPVTLLAATAMFASISCQKQVIPPVPLAKSNYAFNITKEIPHLPVLDQQISGTCWAFTMTSFLESEIIRKTGKKIDLSEMYCVRQTYFDKAHTAILKRGQSVFHEGAFTPDALNTTLNYGLMPQENYTGLTNGNTKHDHREMFEKLDKSLKNYVSGHYKGDGWKTEMTAILDQYLGKLPIDFGYEGRTFSPLAFMTQTSIRPHEYIHLTSYTHKPFYKWVPLNLPYNFSNEPYFNVPLDEFMQNIEHAINRGFTVAVELDVSEPTFSGDYGLAVVPENEADNKAILTDPKPEKQVTQAYRQAELENFRTTNDHNVHIVGKATDQNGKVYYKAKNSWSDKSGKDGYMYMSEAYIRLKIIYYTLHQEGLIPETKKGLGL